MSRSYLIPVGDVLVDPTAWQTPFACDVQRCRGACCTVPGADGAPLLPEEVPVVEELARQLLPMLPPPAQEVVQQMGATVQTERGAFTRCVGEGACVFVFWEQGIARCAIERAWEQGASPLRKPLSCHLFPLRLYRSAHGTVLRFEPFSECAPAYAHGRHLGCTATEMVREALARVFGAEWYEELQRTITRPLCP